MYEEFLSKVSILGKLLFHLYNNVYNDIVYCIFIAHSIRDIDNSVCLSVHCVAVFCENSLT